MVQELVNWSTIVIGWITHALPTLSPSACSILLTLINHTIIQSRVIKLPIHILLMYSQLSISLRSHLFHFLHRDVLLHALTGTSTVSFIHILIPV